MAAELKEEPQQRIPAESMKSIIHFVGELCSNIKRILRFASEIERVKFKESFRFILVQYIKFYVHSLNPSITCLSSEVTTIVSTLGTNT